jgi:nicotinamide-nucleotide amidase
MNPAPDSAAIIALLSEKSWSIAAAESLTGGLLVSALIDTPGASRAVRGGIVAYDTHLKHSLVGVDAQLLAEHGAVHPDVARQLADRVRLAAAIDGVSADVGIGTTGVAGPDPQDGQPVGTVFVGISIRGAVDVAALRLEGTRDEIRRSTVEHALRALREALESV